MIPTSSRHHALSYEGVAKACQHVVSGLMVAAIGWCIGLGLMHVWPVVIRAFNGTLLHPAWPAPGLRGLIYYWPYVLIISSLLLLGAIFLHARHRSGRTSRAMLMLAAGIAMVAGAGYPVAAVLWWPPRAGLSGYELYQRVMPLWGIVVYALVPALLLLSLVRPSRWQLVAACVGAPLASLVTGILYLLHGLLALLYPDDLRWSWSTGGPAIARTAIWFATAGVLLALCMSARARSRLGHRRAWTLVAIVTLVHIVMASMTEYWMHGSSSLDPAWQFSLILQQIGLLAGIFALPWIVKTGPDFDPQQQTAI